MIAGLHNNTLHNTTLIGILSFILFRSHKGAGIATLVASDVFFCGLHCAESA